MKATRKLIPAFAMLLIAAVMMSTATFAWFSTNTTVTADGMSIQAKSETIFLQIVDGQSNFVDDENQTKASASNKTAQLAPVSAVKSIDDGNTSVTALDVIGTAGTRFKLNEIKWVTAFSDDMDNYEIGDGSEYTDVTAAYTPYVLANTFKVRLDAQKGGGKVAGKDLTVVNKPTIAIKDATSSSDAKSLLDAVRVLIAGPDGVAIYDVNGLVAGNAVICDSLDKNGTPVIITVYVYFDGEDEACFSNNVDNVGELLETYEVDFGLTVSAASQA